MKMLMGQPESNGMTMGKRKKTTIYKTLHRKLKIEQHKPHKKPE
jgi:hypothetical protein